MPFSEPISLKCNLSVYAKQKTLASLIPARVSVFLKWCGPAPTRRGNRLFKLFKLPTKFKNTKAPIKSRLLWCGPESLPAGRQGTGCSSYILNLSFHKYKSPDKIEASVVWAGIEPATQGFSVLCSTN